jgi:hypothetical protein
VQGAGQAAPNGSVFPIIANASDKTGLLYNFNTAVNFTNFVQPLGSSLFLFPTDEIANLQNPFATGLHHPGGLDFAADSVQAQAILKWAGGLRPDGQGFNLNWLVAGTYAVAQITDPTPIIETTVEPSLFDPSFAQQFNGGIWEGLFSPSQNIDLNTQFAVANNSGRVAYAVTYVINTTTVDIQGRFLISSDNAIEVFVNKQPVLQASDARNAQAGFAFFPASATSGKTTEILVKVFQRQADQNFNFKMQFQDQFGNLLTDKTGELVFKSSPGGGI